GRGVRGLGVRLPAGRGGPGVPRGNARRRAGAGLSVPAGGGPALAGGGAVRPEPAARPVPGLARAAAADRPGRGLGAVGRPPLGGPARGVRIMNVPIVENAAGNAAGNTAGHAAGNAAGSTAGHAARNGAAARNPAAGARTVLELEGVHESFGETEIIRGVDLALIEGERHAIIGPNGAGKSTLFHLISGQLQPTRGTITLDGRPIQAL